MSKQTAVEWLHEMLKDNCKEVFEGNIWEQAKEMEKQQIIDSWIDGKENKEFGNTVFEDAEQYYNNTFKK
jgi:hypothetical protein